MTTRKTFPAGINPHGETEDLKQFTVLYMEGPDFKRENAEGKVISAAKSEIEIATSFPLRAKQVVYWADKHKQDNLHFAMVKWAKRKDDAYRVGLSLL